MAKKKAKPTDITIILDRSGSMQSTKADAIGGFNSFLSEQKKIEGVATLTMIQFDTGYEVVYSGKPLAEVPELTDETYVPGGMTALVDAMGRGITELGKRVNALKKKDQPQCVVVIITDGGENSSSEYNNAGVAALIKEHTEKRVQFVFIGANQDAIATAQQYNIGAANSLSYGANSLGTQAVFASMSKNIGGYRSATKMDMSFDDSDKLAQANAGVVQ